MDQKNSSNTGAPSTDTTQALFVSARKKQLEQQEAERLAKEREEERLAAEAEVRRLEQAVAERKRRAQEEALRVEEEAARRREQAELDAKQAAEEAARARAAAQEAPPPSSKPAPAQKAAKQARQTGQTRQFEQTGQTGAKSNKIALIAGGAVLLVVAVVLVIVLAGGGGNKANAVNPETFSNYISSEDGLGIRYPGGWTGETVYESTGLFLQSGDKQSTVFALSLEDVLQSAAEEGTDALTAVEDTLYLVAGMFAEGGGLSGIEPNLQKSGGTVRGDATFYYTADGIPMKGHVNIESKDGVAVLTAYAIPSEAGVEENTALCEAILGTLSAEHTSGSGEEPDAPVDDGRPYWETDDRFTYFYDMYTGLSGYIAKDLYDAMQSLDYYDGAVSSCVVFDRMTLFDYSDGYRSIVGDQGGTLEDVAYLLMEELVASSGFDMDYINVILGSPYAEGEGQRLDFGFWVGGAWATGVLRADSGTGNCIIGVGLDLEGDETVYFDALVSSAALE